MISLLTAVPTGITAFIATNLDDIMILMLLFSQVSSTVRRRHIVTGQYLGFTALVLASLPGFFGGLLIPQAWIGMLGIVPIIIGTSRLLNSSQDGEQDSEDESLSVSQDATSPFSFLSPQSMGIAAITFANGGDNIGIYVPLFANCTLDSLLVILTVFLSLIGLWCYLAYRLTHVPMIAEVLTRYGAVLVPFVLIGLGMMILLESHTLEDYDMIWMTLAASALSIIGRTHTFLNN